MAEQPDQFVIELGRASKRVGSLLRGLSRADADDVLAQALLEAWERHDENVPPDIWPWFRDIVRHARSKLAPSRGSQLRLAAVMGAADAEHEAALAQLIERVSAAVDESDRPLLELYSQGYSVPEIATSVQMPPAFVRKRLRKLRHELGPMRKWLPEISATISSATPKSTDIEGVRDNRFADSDVPPIDHEVEKLLRRPATPSADCVICWRCSWFDGLAPPEHFVLQGVEQRKREIAEAISAGTLQELKL